MRQWKLLPILAAMVLMFAAPGMAQQCGTREDCARMLESLVNGTVNLNGKSATQAMSVNGCEFVRTYSQWADGCTGDKFEFEETDQGSFATMSSAFVQQYGDHAASLLFGPGAVQKYRLCEECRVRERSMTDAGIVLPAVNPMDAQRVANAASRLAVLCGARNVNKPDPVTNSETRLVPVPK